MKKILSLLTVLVLIFSGVQLSKASPLVFKTTKIVKSIDFEDLTIIDLSKYKQVRIGIKVKPDDSTTQRVNIYALEGEQEIYLFGQSEKDLNFSTLIDSPPAKIKLKGRGNGTYQIYIWASQ